MPTSITTYESHDQKHTNHMPSTSLYYSSLLHTAHLQQTLKDWRAKMLIIINTEFEPKVAATTYLLP